MESEEKTPTPSPTPAQQVVIDYVDKNIDLLVNHFNDYCTKYKTPFVPLEYIVACAIIQKSAFRTGVTNANAGDEPQPEGG